MSEQNQFCIITYNLLSPWYVKPNYFPDIEKQYLDDESRFKRTLGLLQKWINNKAVICLQELCEQWAHHLKKFFAENNYRFDHVTYAKGKSGVSISYPLELFDTMTISSGLCFDKNKFNEIKNYTKNLQIIKELANASESENQYIAEVMRVKKTGQKLLLATYHMPCRPLQKYFLVSHIHGLKASLFDISQMYQCDHVVLSGDFNIIAGSQEYDFLARYSSQNADVKDPDFIKELRQIYAKTGKSIDPMIDLQSSHLKHHGSEPKYTNVSAMSDGVIFIECLDYCLTSKSIKIIDCMVDLVIDNPKTSSYPNESCPSDHQPLITRFTL